MFSNLEQFSIARFGEARLASQFSLARTFLHSGYFHCYCYCLAIQPRPHISLFSQKVTMGGMAGLVSQADEQVGHNWYERWIMWLVFLVFFNCSYWKPPYSRTTCNAFPSTALSWPQEIAQSIISGISDGKYKYKVIENTSFYKYKVDDNTKRLSLDIEGAEFQVLQTIPWDKVDIEVCMYMCTKVTCWGFGHFFSSEWSQA